MHLVSKFAEQAFAGSGPCALVRPPRGLLGMEWELIWMSGDSELDWGGLAAGVVESGSAVRALAHPVYPAGYLRRVGHVGGPAVRGCDDSAARSAFVISTNKQRIA
ncbi:hypothetical protein GW17_00038340 [Ensete ventricosum]|nr:hypothetical protein GW17_00038340 [Ensete ventricosum]